MASSSRPSGASVPGGLDVAWKYARPIKGNKHGTICTFCESTFQSGGITRLKYHLAGFDPHKSVKKCKEVPLDIKNEVIAWIKDKDNPVDDDDKDGYAYPPDMHPAEKEDYLTAIRASNEEEWFRQGGVYGMGSKRFARGAVVVVNRNIVALKAFETHSDLLRYQCHTRTLEQNREQSKA
ncbi:hypothetical protein ACFXTN_011280 [Malus domestica]